MNMQPSNKRRGQRSEGLARTQAYTTVMMQNMARRLSKSTHTVKPTEDQRHFVITSFILGCISLVTAFFPICGFPIAITGLLIGVYGRYVTTLRIMSAWAIGLSSIGLLLTIVNVIVMTSIYFSTYLLR